MSLATLLLNSCYKNRSPDTIHMTALLWLLPMLLLFSRALADITLLFVGLAFLLRSYKSNDWAWAKQTWFRCSLLFWLYLISINTVLSIDTIDSFLHAIFFIRWPLFAAALAYWLFNHPIRQRHFLIALLLTIAFIIFDSSLQYFTGQDLFGLHKASATRLTGPYSRPIPGIMMLRVLFIAMFITYFLPNLSLPKKRIALVLSMLFIGLIFTFITGERMALMLFACGSLVVFSGLFLEQKKHQTSILFGVGALVITSVSAVLLSPEMAERSVYSIYEKLRYFSESDYGVVFRAALAAWHENPLFGSGFHTYKNICNEMGLLAQWGSQWHMQCSHPHNLYLQLAAETGIIGLALYIVMVAALYFKALSLPTQSKQWLLTSLSFTILSVSFWPLIGGISLFNNGIAAVVWLGVGWTLSVSTLNRSPI